MSESRRRKQPDVWELGVIVELAYGGSIIRLNDGREELFNGDMCLWDGTSSMCLRVGDAARRRVRDGAISSPNLDRWAALNAEAERIRALRDKPDPDDPD